MKVVLTDIGSIWEDIAGPCSYNDHIITGNTHRITIRTRGMKEWYDGRGRHRERRGAIKDSAGTKKSEEKEDELVQRTMQIRRVS